MDVAAVALDLTALTAGEIVARVHDGLSCAVDVATAYLARIAEQDPRIGAFEAHDPRRVMIEAGAVDTRHDRFALPLAGVPVAVGDSIDVAGYPTRRGSAATSTEPAKRDDELVKRLRAAGAVIVGKTRMPELGFWGTTGSALGSTRNPLDVTLDPGGAEGGAAAAVAARMAALAIGVDGGGDLRIPAAQCGLVAVKAGVAGCPLPHGDTERWRGLGAVGVLARSTQDAATALAVLRGGTVATDGASDGAPITRVALSLHHPTHPRTARLHADQRAAVIGAAARLRAWPVDAAVGLADPPYPTGLAGAWRRRRRAGLADDLATLTGLDLAALEPRTARAARQARPPVRAGRGASWCDRMTGWLDDGGYDLLICPAVPGPPGRSAPVTRYGAAMRATTRAAAYTLPWNLAGLPAVVVPVVVDGRPAAVQLVGRPGAEARLLAAAAVLEQRAVPAAGAAEPRIYE